MTNDEIRAFLENAIQENKVMLFMKGTPHEPACGFSARASGCLNALGVQYSALDILPDPRIREELSGLSGWPTIPQLFVGGELVGGSDIVLEMFEPPPRSSRSSRSPRSPRSGSRTASASTGRRGRPGRPG